MTAADPASRPSSAPADRAAAGPVVVGPGTSNGGLEASRELPAAMPADDPGPHPRVAGEPAGPAKDRAPIQERRTGGTGFFPDPGAWQFLEGRVIPAIVGGMRPDQPIRAWVLGCATGEEAYSLAMLLTERAGVVRDRAEFRIFATETDREALEVARAGVYPAWSIARVSPGRLDRFFVRDGDRYRVGRELRQNVIFASHELLAAPPFARLDLVCCRDLRGDLEPAVRGRILRIFHGVLRREGYLFLGSPGTDARPEGLFETVSEEWGILRRIGLSHRELTGIALAAVVINRQFQIREFTRAATRLLRLTPDEIGRPLDDLMRKTIDPDLRRDVGTVLETLKPIAREIRDPEGRWFIRRVLPYSIKKERPEGVVATFEEVTSLKQAEQAAKEARTYAESIVATVHEPLVVLGADLRVRSANASFYRTFRTTPAETEGQSLFDLCDGCARDSRLPGLLDRVLREGVSLDDFEAEIEFGGLGCRTLRLNARRIEPMSLILLAIEDITERQRAVQALRESEQRFRLVSENIPNQVWVVTPDGRPLFGNHRWLSYLGLTLDQLRDGGWEGVVHPDDQGPSQEAWERALRDGTDFRLKLRLRGADGRYRWFLSQAFPLRDRTGAIASWYGTNTDIDEAVRAEQALRENEERLRAALEAADIGTWRVDLQAGTVTRCPNCNRLLGLAPEASTQPVDDYFARVHPEDRQAVRALFDRASRGVEVYDTENRIVRPDGTVRWVRSRGKVYFGADGRPLYMTGAGVDITERKQGELALEQSQRRLQTLFENAQEAILLADDRSRLVDVNPAACTLTGYTRDELLRRTVADLAPEADRAGVPSLWRAYLGAGRLEGEFGLLRKDGAQLTVECRAVARILPGLHLAVLHDVTARKQTEARLREREERLQAIVATAADGMIITDERGVIDSLNPAAERIFGYAAAELIGRKLALLLPPPYGDRHDDDLRDYLRAGRRRVIGTSREVVGRRKDGSTFPMELSVSEFRDGDRRKFTGIVRDVTERKRLEREVLEIPAREQRRIGQELHDSTGQELTGLGLMAQSLANRLGRESPTLGGIATKIVAGIGRVHEQLRRIAKGLVPVEVDPAGLMAALAELAARTSESGAAACRFECPAPVSVGDSVTATHLYRIAQEAVTNALKHGRASHIRIILERAGDLAVLKVRDDGLGFPRPLEEHRGMGLRIMRHRAGLIGATLSVGPADGGGTLVTCTFSEGAHHGEEEPTRAGGEGDRP